jgi:hypothetical protein
VDITQAYPHSLRGRWPATPQASAAVAASAAAAV